MTLTQILQKIREAFYTKKEIDSMGGGSSLSDTISQKANDSNVVHKTGDYLTGALKYNTNSTNDTYLGGIEYLKDNTRFGYLLGHVYNNGQTKDLLIHSDDHIYISSNYVTLSNGANGGNALIYDNGILYNLNGALGTSTDKWKTINGLNPGALSLPSISNTGANAWIALDTTDWVKFPATSAAQKYMPPADGWLNVRVDNATLLGLASTGGGNYMHQMVRSETPNSLALLLPVTKNIEIAILVNGNENLTYTRATFYYCQGNV